MTVIALSFLTISTVNTAQAGFYSWLDQKNEVTQIITSQDIETEKHASFGSLFAWGRREEIKKINTDSESTPTEEPKPEVRIVKTYNVRATAYSSTPDQTDDTPFITAKGTYVRDGIIAANFLPFGTKIRIPEIYGEKIFVVEDRMNRRYWYNIDIWFPERHQALTFGSQRVTIEIVEES